MAILEDTVLAIIMVDHCVPFQVVIDVQAQVLGACHLLEECGCTVHIQCLVVMTIGRNKQY